MTLIQIPAEEVKAGDMFVDKDNNFVWTALRDAIRGAAREIHIDVQYEVDGGCSTRVWEADSDFKLNISRVRNER